MKNAIASKMQNYFIQKKKKNEKNLTEEEFFILV